MTHEPRSTLFVTTRPIWPPTAGYAIRSFGIWWSCRVLRTSDAVLLAPNGDRRELPPAAPADSIVTLRVVRRSAVSSIARWLFTQAPWGWCRIDWSGAREQLNEHVSRLGCEVVVISGIDGWAAVADALRPFVTIDVDDVESAKISHRLARWTQAYRGLGGIALMIRDTVDRRRWSRIEQEIVQDARSVVVCSEADRRLLESGRSNVFDVPNIYPMNDMVERTPRSSATPPVILFVGSLVTRPNEEACRFLVETIMPILWRTRPDAVVRLVGRASPVIMKLAGERVQVPGFVEDLSDEFRGADIVVAPFLSGGGTRIKILEAFRNRIPVVTTSVGCEGLAVEDGVHALVRDSPRSFAEACLTIFSDRVLVEQLASSAFAFAEERHSLAAMTAAVDRALNFSLEQS